MKTIASLLQRLLGAVGVDLAGKERFCLPGFQRNQGVRRQARPRRDIRDREACENTRRVKLPTVDHCVTLPAFGPNGPDHD